MWCEIDCDYCPHEDCVLTEEEAVERAAVDEVRRAHPEDTVHQSFLRLKKNRRNRAYDSCRYATDTEYREQCKARARKNYARRKAAKR